MNNACRFHVPHTNNFTDERLRMNLLAFQRWTSRWGRGSCCGEASEKCLYHMPFHVGYDDSQLAMLFKGLEEWANIFLDSDCCAGGVCTDICWTVDLEKPTGYTVTDSGGPARRGRLVSSGEFFYGVLEDTSGNWWMPYWNNLGQLISEDYWGGAKADRFQASSYDDNMCFLDMPTGTTTWTVQTFGPDIGNHTNTFTWAGYVNSAHCTFDGTDLWVSTPKELFQIDAATATSVDVFGSANTAITQELSYPEGWILPDGDWLWRAKATAGKDCLFKMSSPTAADGTEIQISDEDTENSWYWDDTTGDIWWEATDSGQWYNCTYASSYTSKTAITNVCAMGPKTEINSAIDLTERPRMHWFDRGGIFDPVAPWTVTVGNQDGNCQQYWNDDT